MFPSPNCNNSLLKTSPSLSSPSPSSFPFDQNPNLKHDNILFNFHESPLDQIFYQSHLANPEKLKPDHDQIPSVAPLPRRRKAGKKDRHSKICTAQGIRDRRMRLSLQVARKFFDLQDMLGYDKASKTIEWLFTQSNKAIKELHSPPPPPPPPPLLPNNSDGKSESECEDQSGLIEEIIAPTTEDRTKASREKARARARCRTREKMLVKQLRLCGNPNPFEGGVNSEIRVSQSDVGMIDKFLGNSEYQCAVSDPSLVGFIGNWDVLSNCFHVSTAGNLNSLFSSPTPEFP